MGGCCEPRALYRCRSWQASSSRGGHRRPTRASTAPRGAPPPAATHQTTPRRAGRGAVERAVKRLGLDIPVASDSRQTFWRTWDLHGWPTLFLLDARGLIANIHQGEFTAGAAERRVRALLREERSDLPLPEPQS